METQLEQVRLEAVKTWGERNPEYLELIEEALRNNVKISIESVLHIWKIAHTYNIPGLTHSVVWVEEGTDSAGYRHMLKHKEEFEKLGVPEDKLIEVAQAATSVGKAGGSQGRSPGRPILGLFFYGKPMAVAISVGSNGFVVGMNPSNLEKCIKKAGITITELQEIHSWPV